MTLRLTAVFFALLFTAGQGFASGLLTPSDENLPPLRVTDHLVDVTIHDGVAITELQQTFRNDTKQRLEATYVFPLPENADLTDFQMSFNGKMVEGKVLPAKEAKQIYEAIVRQARDPGLIEFIGHRLLQMRVFPVEPESDTTIKVSYQQICRPISGMKGYHYPLRTRATAGQAYGTVRFNVKLDTDAPLKNIWSPTHAVEIVRGKDERTAQVAYEASGGSLEDDFLLLYDTDSSDLGLSVVAYKPKKDSDGHFVLMLTPKQLWPEQTYQPQDVVFVLDTSGSMAGDKIDQAKKSLKYCIEQLNERDRFSIVRFSSGFDVLFDDVAPATEENQKKARAWVEDFRAAGGTNITDTLTHVMGMKPPRLVESDVADDASRPFVVVFLTDGRGNREAPEILNHLADAGKDRDLTGLRIFPFGVGHDVNTKLLDRLSDNYTGRPTYVQPGENLELVLGDFFSVISRPVLTNLQLSLPDISATDRFPATLGDLYHGQQITIAGRMKNEATGPVKLTAQRGGERVEYVWPDVKFTSTDDADYVPDVWAGRKIAYLIDQIRTTGESTEMVEEILALSQEHSIQTPYSSWLVNPEGVHPNFYSFQSGASRLRPSSAMRAPATRPAPGPGGGGGGGLGGGGRGVSGGIASPAVRDRLEDAAGEAFYGQAGEDPDRVGTDIQGLYGDEFSDIDLALAAQSVEEESGKAANLIARRNAQLREARSKDDSRLNQDALAYRKIGDQWYNRLGQYLVDERVAEDTEIIVVKFGTDAYFDLVTGRKDLRKALATSRHMVVLPADGVAVLISDRAGIEEFSEAQREQMGLPKR